MADRDTPRDGHSAQADRDEPIPARIRDELIRTYMWQLHSEGQEAAAIAAKVSERFGPGDRVVTPEGIVAWIAQMQVERIRAYTWRLHSVGQEAAAIAAKVNEHIGRGEEVATPEGVAAWIAQFEALRDWPPATPAEMRDKVAAGLEVLRGELAMDLVDFLWWPDIAEKRQVAVRALHAVCDFVEGFAVPPGEDGRSLTGPLLALEFALLDLDRGTTHPMLTRRKVVGRPPMPYGQAYLIAVAVQAMEAAVAEGNTLDQAGKMVAGELDRRGYGRKRDGGPVKGTTVKNWRARAHEGPRPHGWPGPAYDEAVEVLRETGPLLRAMPVGAWRRILDILDKFGPTATLRRKGGS